MTMSHRPLVSVITPVYNDQGHLREAIESALGQTVQSIEVICVDDGSTDGSLETLHDLQSEDTRVIVKNQDHQGSGPARNLGLATARGKYVSFLDADDYFPSPDVFEALIGAAESAETRVACGLLQTDTQGAIECKDDLACLGKTQIVRYDDYQFDYQFYKYIYERSLIEQNTLAFPALLRFQDPPFFVRAMHAAQHFCFVPMASYVYRKQNKVIDWNMRRVTDYAKGVLDVLLFAREHKLAKLHERSLVHIEHNWYEFVVKRLQDEDSQELRAVLQQINDAVDPQLMRLFRPTFPNDYLIRPLREAPSERVFALE